MSNHEDNGVGITSKQFSYVFKNFYVQKRLASTRVYRWYSLLEGRERGSLRCGKPGLMSGTHINFDADGLCALFGLKKGEYQVIVWLRGGEQSRDVKRTRKKRGGGGGKWGSKGGT